MFWQTFMRSFANSVMTADTISLPQKWLVTLSNVSNVELISDRVHLEVVKIMALVLLCSTVIFSTPTRKSVQTCMCAIVCEAEAENRIVFGDKNWVFWIKDIKLKIKWKKITTISVKSARFANHISSIADAFESGY